MCAYTRGPYCFINLYAVKNFKENKIVIAFLQYECVILLTNVFKISAAFTLAFVVKLIYILLLLTFTVVYSWCECAILLTNVSGILAVFTNAFVVKLI